MKQTTIDSINKLAEDITAITDKEADNLNAIFEQCARRYFTEHPDKEMTVETVKELQDSFQKFVILSMLCTPKVFGIDDMENPFARRMCEICYNEFRGEKQ